MTASTLLATLLFAACGLPPITPGIRFPTPTATVAPAACTSHAQTTALVRVVGQQLQGSIGVAADGALSAFHYPLGLPNEDFVATVVGNPLHPGYSVFSPDGRYLATNILEDGPNIVSTYPYLIDTATHAVTRLPLPSTLNVDGASHNEWLRERSLAWEDNHTLLFFTGANTNTTLVHGSAGTRVYTYNVTSHTVGQLPGVSTAAGGIVRCGILYYQQVTPLTAFGPTGWLKGAELLHRYNLQTHSEIGAPISLGDTDTYVGYEGQINGPGWDVSPDGSRLVYQQTVVTATPSSLVMTSQFLGATPNGSHAGRILVPAAPTVNMLITISPNGQLVAATDGDVGDAIDPTIRVVAPTLAGGTEAGSTVESFSIASTVLPAWTAGDTFYASPIDLAIEGIGTPVEQFHFDGGGIWTESPVLPGATYAVTLTP